MIARCGLLVALLLVAATSAWCQTSTAGTVLGQVLDEQHAAVPGASVKLVDTSTNIIQTTASNSDGRYVFTQVNPGNYNLSFCEGWFRFFSGE